MKNWKLITKRILFSYYVFCSISIILWICLVRFKDFIGVYLLLINYYGIILLAIHLIVSLFYRKLSFKKSRIFIFTVLISLNTYFVNISSYRFIQILLENKTIVHYLDNIKKDKGNYPTTITKSIKIDNKYFKNGDKEFGEFRYDVLGNNESYLYYPINYGEGWVYDIKNDKWDYCD